MYLAVTHKARHHLCCQSPCQIQLQPWASSLASCQACTLLFEGHHTPQTCLPSLLILMLIMVEIQTMNGKSTGGYVVKIGSEAVLWSSKLQPLVALSTTEAEHIPAVEAGKEINPLDASSSWGSLAMTSLPDFLFYRGSGPVGSP